MKLIKTLAAIFLCAFASAAPIQNTEPAFRSSIVDQGNGTYLYTYSVDPWKLATTKDLSNFNVFWCEDVVAYNFKSNIGFDIELEKGYVSFVNLESDNNDTTVTFTFESANIPTDGIVTYKAGKDVWDSVAKVPSCVTIPETSTTGLLAGAFALLFLRRRR
jgi:hypothetical protein